MAIKYSESEQGVKLDFKANLVVFKTHSYEITI